MDIVAGDFIIRSDTQCCWIERVFVGVGKDDRPKVSYKRVTGYHANFRDMLDDFSQRRIRSSDATNAKQLMAEIADAEKDLLDIVHSIEDELSVLDPKTINVSTNVKKSLQSELNRSGGGMR